MVCAEFLNASDDTVALGWYLCITWQFHSVRCRSERGVSWMFVREERIITCNVNLMATERSRTNDWQKWFCQIYFCVNALNADWLIFPPLADQCDLLPWLCSWYSRHVVVKGDSVKWVGPLCGLFLTFCRVTPCYSFCTVGRQISVALLRGLSCNAINSSIMTCFFVASAVNLEAVRASKRCYLYAKLYLVTFPTLLSFSLLCCYQPCNRYLPI